MDAQNAAESDQTRPAAASPQRRRASNAEPKSPTTMRAKSPAKDAKGAKDGKSANDPKDTKDAKPKAKSSSASSATARPDDAPEDRDSDAETIVLPGKDGHSPSKIRKVRQEDKGESDGDAAKGNGQPKAARNPDDKDKDKDKAGAAGAAGAAGSRTGDGVKKKRLPGSGAGSTDKDRQPRNKDGSSGLSSAPASPPQNQHQKHQHQRQQHQQRQQAQQRRRRSDAGPPSPTDSELSQYTASSKTSLRDKLKSGERLLPHKRKAPKAESDDDEVDGRKPRRQRTSSVGLDNGRLPRDKDGKPTPSKQHDTRTRSISPQLRQHRRSISTQLAASQAANGLNQKKKRLPPPLQPTDYNSDDSSASGSPHPRGSKVRSLATPVNAESNHSPVKMGPNKKHLDAHGQTLLARACARGEYDGAKQRLTDRPEDLNVADYAGNTPLQIAAINGCEGIVKLLIDAGCNLDCVNYDKDTPLLDAVDNGHLGVVTLLLDAGVNPRKANVNGEEPIDRVDDERDNAQEIRAALVDARKRAGERQRTSEDRHSLTDNHDTRDSHAPDSPRHSPAATASGATARRSVTVRSTKTRNDLLYMPLDDKTLRQAAGRGDEETVARILQVKEGYDDPESMVAAARGGHDLVIQLLLGLGGANADPGPVASLQSEFATPILAAIGQENIKVVELLLNQQGFDPTRRFKGETYYEIARRRQGTNWKEEEQMLKNSYDEYKRSHKDGSKTKSPGRREREREEKRAKRGEARDETRPHKRNMSSPSRETESRKKATSSKVSSPKEKRRSNSFASHGDEELQKRGPGRPAKRDDRVPSINVSDREISPALSHKMTKSKRADSEMTGVSSEGEAVKPRRKLVSKGELRGEREKHKRSSTSSSLKEPSSPHESRSEEPSEKQKLSEKYHDRTKALKRDESRDHLSVSGDGTSKRHRNSVTPDRPSDGDKDDGEAPVKRRRLDSDGQDKRQKRPVSVDGRPRKSSSSGDSAAKPAATPGSKDRNVDKESRGLRDAQRKDSDRPATAGEKSIHVKSEDVDVEMPDAEPTKETEDAAAPKARDDKKDVKKKELAEQEETKKEEERKRAEAQEKKKLEEEETRKREEEEAQRKEKEEKKKQEEEAALKVREKAEREQREAEDAVRREEEEKKRLEEEEAKKKEEEERKQREEEERLRKEKLEREAAEEARKQREEDERKERERRERAHREEIERKRAAREAEQKRIRDEQEQARLDKLPPLLRWLDKCPNPKTPAVGELFKYLQGVRYDCIRPEANNTPEGRERWVLNVQAALILGEKDLDLSRYTAWAREPASYLAKLTLWRTDWLDYTLFTERMWDLGRQLPGCYGSGEDPTTMSMETRDELKKAAWDRFLNMDLFFVKASDLLYTVPNIPHLHNIKLGVQYREVIGSDKAKAWDLPKKWKRDPDADRYHGFCPRYKWYINGDLVGEELPVPAQISKTPFDELPVPRRGLLRVYPDDPDYARICKEQGLDHLLLGQQSPQLPNGVHSSSPISQASVTPSKPTMNGAGGHLVHEEPAAVEAATNGTKLNCINGT